MSDRNVRLQELEIQCNKKQIILAQFQAMMTQMQHQHQQMLSVILQVVKKTNFRYYNVVDIGMYI